MDRKQFTFYRSFMDGIRRIRAKSARCEAYDAIISYALDGIEPELDKMSDAAALAFIMAKPNLDASRKKAEAGRKGGESKDEANAKQTASKPQANRKQEREQEREQDREQMLKESKKKSRAAFQAPTKQEVEAYCKEKGYSIDPQRFIDYYQRQGWKLSNGQPMKDWQSAVRLWGREKKPTSESRSKTAYSGNPDPNLVRASIQQLLELEGEDPESVTA